METDESVSPCWDILAFILISSATAAIYSMLSQLHISCRCYYVTAKVFCKWICLPLSGFTCALLPLSTQPIPVLGTSCYKLLWTHNAMDDNLQHGCHSSLVVLQCASTGLACFHSRKAKVNNSLANELQPILHPPPVSQLFGLLQHRDTRWKGMWGVEVWWLRIFSESVCYPGIFGIQH